MSVSHLFLTNLENTFEIFPSDLNSTLSGNSTHPVSGWVNSEFEILAPWKNVC